MTGGNSCFLSQFYGFFLFHPIFRGADHASKYVTFSNFFFIFVSRQLVGSGKEIAKQFGNVQRRGGRATKKDFRDAHKLFFTQASLSERCSRSCAANASRAKIRQLKKSQEKERKSTEKQSIVRYFFPPFCMHRCGSSLFFSGKKGGKKGNNTR